MTTGLTQRQLIQDLQALGLPAGAQVLVHSALSSLGYVAGGADTVINALLATIGAAGTLLAPTLTGSEALSPANPPVFDPAQTPGWTGRIPETLRQRPQAIRSLHPTHSVAALGAQAQALTQDHVDSVTPCDELSPYGRLAQRIDAYILLLGVDHESNTTFHHIEEIGGAAYHMQPGFAAAQIHLPDKTLTRNILLHAYGTPRHFMALEPLLIERGIQQTGMVGAATARLIHTRPFVELGLRCLRASPRVLCAS